MRTRLAARLWVLTVAAAAALQCAAPVQACPAPLERAQLLVQVRAQATDAGADPWQPLLAALRDCPDVSAEAAALAELTDAAMLRFDSASALASERTRYLLARATGAELVRANAAWRLGRIIGETDRPAALVYLEEASPALAAGRHCRCRSGVFRDIPAETYRR